MKALKQTNKVYIYELLSLKVNGPSCNCVFVEMYSSTCIVYSLHTAWLANYLAK